MPGNARPTPWERWQCPAAFYKCEAFSFQRLSTCSEALKPTPSAPRTVSPTWCRASSRAEHRSAAEGKLATEQRTRLSIVGYDQNVATVEHDQSVEKLGGCTCPGQGVSRPCTAMCSNVLWRALRNHCTRMTAPLPLHICHALCPHTHKKYADSLTSWRNAR